MNRRTFLGAGAALARCHAHLIHPRHQAQRGCAGAHRRPLRDAARVAGGACLTPEQVRSVIAERSEARAAKNFARSDELRAMLISSGVDVLDSKSGSSWRFA